MPDEQATAMNATNPKEVDRIRDIIFGGQMREYAQRFQMMQRDMERLQGEIERLSEELADYNRDIDKKLQQARRDARQADDDLRMELRQTADKLMDEKADRMALSELFIEMGNQLKAGGSFANILKSLGQAE